ncbi:unnamed protein product [Effrenium voratum]|uniref:Uncharacterized protein n=1 Tax=Effrenium voratum TaxID=2562239 RepID=A0AA36N3S6_9DINO|nr:unnamed protein product [Effrenium voratum]CAJ1439935.1 unnamed protein product [Effrenium voratum]
MRRLPRPGLRWGAGLPGVLSLGQHEIHRGCACANTCPGYKAYGCAGASNCEMDARGGLLTLTEEEWCSRGIPGERRFANVEEVMATARAQLKQTLTSMVWPLGW